MKDGKYQQHVKTNSKMSDDIIEITAPEALLDSNLKFPKEVPLVKHLTVTRERCVNPTLVDSFLRLLRYGSDDSMRQRLSAYHNYEKEGRYNEKKCDKFLTEELYPNWHSRDRVIGFCNGQLGQMKTELDQRYGQDPATFVRAEVDLRLDPYAARDRAQEQEDHYKQWKRLNKWVENQKRIESILRTNSNRVLRQNCDQNADYLEDFWNFQHNHRT